MEDVNCDQLIIELTRRRLEKLIIENYLTTEEVPIGGRRAQIMQGIADLPEQIRFKLRRRDGAPYRSGLPRKYQRL